MDKGSIWFMTCPFLVGWIGFLGPMVTCHVMKPVFVTGSDFDFDFGLIATYNYNYFLEQWFFKRVLSVKVSENILWVEIFYFTLLEINVEGAISK